MTSKARQLADLGGDTANLEDVSSAYGSGALSSRNKIINGGMVIDQRNGGSLVSNANGFITDRWSLGKYDPTGGAYSGQQVTDAPSGFTNSLKVTVTTSVSQASSAYWQAFQRLEGYNTADLGFGTASPKNITISFWVKSSVTGSYSLAIFNEGVGSVNRAYATTYTINSANTWEYKTVTLTGDGIAGSGYWGTTNNKGMGLYFDLGCGVAEEISANTWSVGNARRVAGTVRLMDTLNATWQITGVQLEVGDTATPFEHRSYGQELALCQRYFCKIQNNMGGTRYLGMLQAFTSSATFGVIADYPQVMRTVPSVAQGGSFGFFKSDSGNASATTTIGGFQPGNQSWLSGGWGGSSVLTAGHASIMYWEDGAYLTADAEL